MAKRTTEISPGWILLAIGTIVAFPLLKGLFSVFNTAGGILAIPGNFVDAMNRETDENIKDLVYDELMDMAANTSFDQNNATHAALMRELRAKNDGRARAVIQEWTRPKGIELIMKGVSQGLQHQILKEATKRIDDYLKKWW